MFGERIARASRDSLDQKKRRLDYSFARQEVHYTTAQNALFLWPLQNIMSWHCILSSSLTSI